MAAFNECHRAKIAIISKIHVFFSFYLTLPEMRDMRLPCTADIGMKIDTARHLHEVKNAQ